MPDHADYYLTLRNALKERLEVIADHDWRDRDPVSHLERLKTVSETLEALRKELPRDAPPKMGHYLQQCSYAKALALLEWIG